jgi:hypothetical protein
LSAEIDLRPGLHREDVEHQALLSVRAAIDEALAARDLVASGAVPELPAGYFYRGIDE